MTLIIKYHLLCDYCKSIIVRDTVVEEENDFKILKHKGMLAAIWHKSTGLQCVNCLENEPLTNKNIYGQRCNKESGGK